MDSVSFTVLIKQEKKIISKQKRKPTTIQKEIRKGKKNDSIAGNKLGIRKKKSSVIRTCPS